jgi:hypothetical protein
MIRFRRLTQVRRGVNAAHRVMRPRVLLVVGVLAGAGMPMIEKATRAAQEAADETGWFHEPSSGRLRPDGADLADWDLAALRPLWTHPTPAALTRYLSAMAAR